MKWYYMMIYRYPINNKPIMYLRKAWLLIKQTHYAEVLWIYHVLQFCDEYEVRDE